MAGAKRYLYICDFEKKKCTHAPLYVTFKTRVGVHVLCGIKREAPPSVLVLVEIRAADLYGYLQWRVRITCL